MVAVQRQRKSALEVIDSFDPEICQTSAIGGENGMAAGEDCPPGGGGIGPAAFARQPGGAPGDTLLAIHEGYGARGGGAKLVLKERKMRAGKDDRVDVAATVEGEHRLQYPAQRAWIRRDAAKLGFGD